MFGGVFYWHSRQLFASRAARWLRPHRNLTAELRNMECAPIWQLSDQVATANWQQYAFCVSLVSGARQVSVETANQSLLPALWQLPTLADQPVADAYVRGRDLVCVLEPTERFPFHTELYWTLCQLPDQLHAAALSLLISVRTDLLDTHPEVQVVTVAPNQVRTLDLNLGPAFTATLPGDVVLIDYAMPEDCRLQSATASGVERTLFAHFLEKGVIRRARLFAAFATGEVNESQVEAICQQLAEAELPLTT